MKTDVPPPQPANQTRVPPDEGAFVDSYLLYIMAQASAAVSAAFHAELAEQGVPVPTWRILASLYPNNTLNVGELARKCLTKQPTLTRQLDRLCAEGLTRREHEARDRRGVLVTLTEAGRARTARYIAMARAHEAKVLEDYSPDEIARLKTMLVEFTERTRAKV